MDACCECGCCAYVCPAHIPLPQYIRAGKNQWRILQEQQKRRAAQSVQSGARST